MDGGKQVDVESAIRFVLDELSSIEDQVRAARAGLLACLKDAGIDTTPFKRASRRTTGSRRPVRGQPPSAQRSDSSLP